MIYKCDNSDCGNEVITDVDLYDALCLVCENGYMQEIDEEE
jgi:hypothetical protein